MHDAVSCAAPESAPDHESARRRLTDAKSWRNRETGVPVAVLELNETPEGALFVTYQRSDRASIEVTAPAERFLDLFEPIQSGGVA